MSVGTVLFDNFMDTETVKTFGILDLKDQYQSQFQQVKVLA